MKALVCHAPVVRARMVNAPVFSVRLGGRKSGIVSIPAIKPHPLLLDFWSFSKGDNADESRDRIVGLNSHVLRAYNFLWGPLSGYGYPGYLPGMVFDGIDDFLVSEEWIFPEGDYAVIAGVTLFEKRSGNSVFSTRDFNGSRSGWNILQYDGDYGRLFLGNQNYKKSSRLSHVTGETRFLSMVRSGNTIAVYLDADPAGIVEIPMGTPNQKTYYLGRTQGVSGGYFHGIIHCSAVYSGALTADELRREMDESFPLYEDIIINR